MSSPALLWLMMGNSSMHMATSELGTFATEKLKLKTAGEHFLHPLCAALKHISPTEGLLPINCNTM